jgi:hypothetical protein
MIDELQSFILSPTCGSRQDFHPALVYTHHSFTLYSFIPRNKDEMKFTVAILFLQFSAVNGVIYDTLFPSERPAVTEDPIDCIFEDFYPYFSALAPNGKVTATATATTGMKATPMAPKETKGMSREGDKDESSGNGSKARSPDA